MNKIFDRTIMRCENKLVIRPKGNNGATYCAIIEKGFFFGF